MTSAYGLAIIDNVRNNTNITRLLCYWGGERERERFFFFCPTYGPKRKFRKSREKPGWKKSKVPFSIRNGGEKLKQVVFPMFISDSH